MAKVKLKSLGKSRQGLFDFVIKHVFTQGKPALSEDGDCQYRGENNTSCAMGCLITDKEYARLNKGWVSDNNGEESEDSIEGLGAETLFDVSIVNPKDKVKMDLIRVMQGNHDIMATLAWRNKSDKEKLEGFKSNMLVTARNFNLNTELLETY